MRSCSALEQTEKITNRGGFAARKRLDMPTAKVVQTPRIDISLLTCGDPGTETILFIHGNLSSSVFWAQTMTALQDQFACIAPDLRGFGATAPLRIDATLGLNDMAEDLFALTDLLAPSGLHLVGHSMGGGVAMKMMIMRPEALKSVTLVNTISPYGYSGSIDEEGTPCHADRSPGGAGYVDAELVRRLALGDRSQESAFSPRNVLSQLYFKPPFVPRNVEALLDSMLTTRIGDDWYPGNSVQSHCGGGLAPGERGIVNAMSRRYFDASGIVNIQPKPPLLWIRGTEDAIVCDQGQSTNPDSEAADRGQRASIPPQPMIRQTRCVLEDYRRQGGSVIEHPIRDAGHTPFIEKPAEFNRILAQFVRSAKGH